MSALDRVSARLTGWRATGKDRGIARCPAHEDSSPSLSVRELPDGRVLVHCFAGCGATDVLAAVGLTMGDLFPEGMRGDFKPLHAMVDSRDALLCLARESQVIAILASDIAARRVVLDQDADRAAVAAGRIGRALRLAGGAR